MYSATSLTDEAGQGDGPPEALHVDLPALVAELTAIHTGVRAFLEEQCKLIDSEKENNDTAITDPPHISGSDLRLDPALAQTSFSYLNPNPENQFIQVPQRWLSLAKYLEKQ